MNTAAVVQIPADIIEALGRANSVDEIKSIVANVSVCPQMARATSSQEAQEKRQ